MMNNIKKYALIALIALVGFGNTVATDFGLGVSGNKTFKLNTRIAPPELKFESTAPLEDITGMVKDASKITSTVTMNAANIEGSTGKISFKVDGLKTGIDNRDEHLKDAEWLDAAKYPDITFDLKELKNVKIKSTDLQKGKSIAEANAIGVFTMHGKTKTMTVPVKLSYLKASAETAKRATGDLFFVEGEFEIALKDFDVRGSKGIVGSKVGEKLSISFKLYYNSN
jgi:polyisoprenoid-binding protein YceI